MLKQIKIDPLHASKKEEKKKKKKTARLFQQRVDEYSDVEWCVQRVTVSNCRVDRGEDERVMKYTVSRSN